MSEHVTTCTDEPVRGVAGTVARCACGWRSSWPVQDGSAEAEAHWHQFGNDPDYRERQKASVAKYHAALTAEGCICEKLTESYSRVLDRNCPMHGLNRPKLPERHPASGQCHDCSCHINPPCGQCENCAHYDHPECPNNCQTCEDHDDE